MRSSVSVIL